MATQGSNVETYQPNRGEQYSAPPSAEKRDKDGDVRMRQEEPASRKMEIDEDYDDEGNEDAKNSAKGSKAGSVQGAGSVRTSPRAGAASVGSNGHGVANGQQAKVEA